MKKINLTIFLCITCAFSLIFGLTGCKDSHTHSYSKQITSASCTGQGYTTYTCECGDFYLDEYIEPLSHSFTNYVSDDNASCELNATETARCDRTGCNEVHIREVAQTATGHNYDTPTYKWSNNYSTVTATAVCKNNSSHKIIETVNTTASITQEQKCTQVELTKYIATFENTFFTVQVKDNIQTKGVLSHSFTNYNYNEDATCTTDGTKTAKCDRCSETDTIIAEGTKLNHSYTNNICGCGAENFTISLIFNLNDDNNSYTVAGISSSSDVDVIVPSNYNGKPVTAIGYEAFNESSIQSITFGNNIASIEAWAFRDCKKLTAIILPEKLTVLKEGAFAGCEYLDEVTMFNNVTSIEKMAFYQCKRMTSITLSQNLTSIGEGAFADNYCLSSIIFPSTLKNIGRLAFSGCSILSSLSFPDTLQVIDEYAFSDCASVSSIIFGTGELTIGPRAFMECVQLEEICIPKNVRYIDIQSFAYCTSLQKVIIAKGVQSIGSAAFQGCSSIEYMELPFIGHSATQDQFLGWIFGICTWYKDNATYVPSSLKTIKFTGNSIPDNALYGCSSINIQFNFDAIYGYEYVINDDNESCTIISVGTFTGSKLVIPEYLDGKYRVSTIGAYAFEDNKTLLSVEFPNSLSVIGVFAFYNCSNLANITIGENSQLESIGVYAFSGCNNLNYNLYDNAKYLGNEKNPYIILMSATSTSISSVVINKNCRVVYCDAFYNCISLSNIIIPDSIKSIGSRAFGGCKNLNSITIGSGVTSMDGETFSGCSSLSSVIIPDNVINIGGSAFYGCTNLVNVTIGKGVTSIGWNAFASCNSLTNIVIPNSVTSIGWGVFASCNNLTSIVFEDVSGWYRTSNYSNWVDKVGGTATNVTNSSTVATYFKSTYSNYYWYKS